MDFNQGRCSAECSFRVSNVKRAGIYHATSGEEGTMFRIQLDKGKVHFWDQV